MKGRTPNSEMGVIGYVIAAGVAVVLLPILPFVAVLWLVAQLGETDQRETEFAG